MYASFFIFYLYKFQNMRQVTLSAPSYSELEAIYLARQIYLPVDDEENYKTEEINQLYKRFARVYNKFRNRNEMKELLS